MKTSTVIPECLISVEFYINQEINGNPDGLILQTFLAKLALNSGN